MSIYKIIVIGASGVGKTSLLNYYKYGKNILQMPNCSTIGVDMYIEHVNNNIALHIWDTAGQEKFYSINKSYYRDAIGAVLCFSLASYESFNDLVKYINDIKKNTLQNTKIVLVGTFLDNDANHVVPDSKVYKLIEKNDISSYVKISNLTGENINIVFANLVRDISMSIESGKLTLKENYIKLVEPTKKNKCCFF